MALHRCVVVGGSIAGLLAAAALADQCREIVLLERDDLPCGPDARRGVPQGPQVHVLLAIGVQKMDELLPGFTDELVAGGGVPLDASADIAVLSSQGWIGRVPSRSRVVSLRRPRLEQLLRRRVLSLPNVTLERANAKGFVADGGRLTGVRLADGRVLEGDLVLDAAGRRSAAADWLAELGYPRPGERHINSHIGYATATVRAPEDLLPDGVAGMIAHPHPGNLHGAAVIPCGEGLHQLAALGMMRAHPPAGFEEFVAHLQQAPSPLVAAGARKVELAAPIEAYRMVGSRRLLWEDLEPRPDGFAAIGDSVMSFNPLYGQGISVAAVEAAALRRTVVHTGSEPQGLGRRIQASFTPTIDAVFGTVLGIDGHYPGADLIGVDPPSAEAAAYGRSLAQLATEDPEASLALKYAAHFFETAGLRSEALVAKVAAWEAGGHTVRHRDPSVIPAALPAPAAPAASGTVPSFQLTN